MRAVIRVIGMPSVCRRLARVRCVNLGEKLRRLLLEVLEAAAAAETSPGDGDWGRKVSELYAERRAGDLARTTGVVDALFKSLLADMLPAQALRAGGLWALKLAPPLRRQAFALGMGADR